MTVGENIKRIRLERGLTQKQLGDSCSPRIAESTIRRYELGKLNPKFETLEKIAKVLSTHPLVLNGSISEEHAQTITRHVDAETAFNSLIREFYGDIDEKQVRVDGVGNAYYYLIGTSDIALSENQFYNMYDKVEAVIKDYITTYGHSEKEEIRTAIEALNSIKRMQL